MKIYFMKFSGAITGAQVVTADGAKHELTTNGELCGLWRDGKQVIGTCDFDLRCAAQTARNRLRIKARFYFGELFNWDYENWEAITVSRKPLFD